MKIRVMMLAFVASAAPLWAADAPSGAAPTDEQIVEQFRGDLQAKRSDVMAKGLTLTAGQAAKFWPLFEDFQKEQNAIIDAQIAATKKYADHFRTLSDAEAVEYVNALLTQDIKMQQLRVKWLTKFQTVVPARTAARAVQLDRRLGQVVQVGLSSRIPLVP